MGSAAMDNEGNLAVGYSVSSLTTSPVDPLRRPPRDRSAERPVPGRGDRSSPAPACRPTPARAGATTARLNVDPADDCTFWYTNEYYTAASQATSTVGWLTRIGSFVLPELHAGGRAGTIQGTVRNSATLAADPGRHRGDHRRLLAHHRRRRHLLDERAPPAPTT